MAEKQLQQQVLQPDQLVDHQVESGLFLLSRCWIEAAGPKGGSEGTGFAILGVRAPL